MAGEETGATALRPPVSVRRTLRDSFAFKGRATRTEIAGYALTAALISLTVSFATGLALRYETHNLIGNVLALLLALPVPALLARRFHDQDRTGRWVLLALFVYAVWAARTGVSLLLGFEARMQLDARIWPLDWAVTLANIATILLIVLPGTNGPNRFGPDPRDRAA